MEVVNCLQCVGGRMCECLFKCAFFNLFLRLEIVILRGLTKFYIKKNPYAYFKGARENIKFNKKNYHGNLVMDKLYHFYQNKILYMHPQGKYIAEKRKQELCIFLLQRKSDNTLYSIISIFRTPSSRDRPAQPHLPANKFFPNNVEVD